MREEDDALTAHYKRRDALAGADRPGTMKASTLAMFPSDGAPGAREPLEPCQSDLRWGAPAPAPVTPGWSTHHLGRLSCAIVAGLFLVFDFPARAQSGTVDTTFSPGFDSDVFTIRVQPNGKLLVSGFFTKVGSSSRNGIARLNSDGTLDTSFDPGS